MGENKVSNCIFCKICHGEEKSDILFENDEIVVFPDVRPAAKHHYLIVTKEHIVDAKHITKDQQNLLQALINKGKEILEERGADMNDVRYGFHWPPFHSVSHLHLHAISPVSEMGFISRAIFKPNSFWFVTPEYVMERLSKL